MRISSHVGRNGSQRDSETDGLDIDQPETSQTRPGVVSRDVSHTASSNSADDVSHSSNDQPSCTVSVW